MVVKRIAVVQSSYIPWKGYFDLIASVDEFVLYDSAQYTKRDWRNRNQIKTPTGLLWLTIPVEVKGKFTQSVRETKIADREWPRKHWSSIEHNYKRAKYFWEYGRLVGDLFKEAAEFTDLSAVNYLFLTRVCALLGIDTRISWSMDYELNGDKTGTLLSVCKQAGASEYVSGPSAKDYLDVQEFVKEDIKVVFFDYSGYRPYVQLFPPFIHTVSIVDLILNEGPNARYFLKSFSAEISRSVVQGSGS